MVVSPVSQAFPGRGTLSCGTTSRQRPEGRSNCRVVVKWRSEVATPKSGGCHENHCDFSGFRAQKMLWKMDEHKGFFWITYDDLPIENGFLSLSHRTPILEAPCLGFHLSFQASAVIGKKTYIYTTDGRRNLCIKPAPAAAWFVPFQQAQRVVRSLMAKCSREKCGEMDLSKIGIPKTLHRIAILLLFQWYIDD